MASLRELGLVEESSAEIILTTFYPNMKPHASVMGVKARGEHDVLLKIFVGTDTFQNIWASRSATINIVSDAELLTKVALADLLGFDESALEFENSKYVNAPKLKGVDAHVEIQVEDVRRIRLRDEIGTSDVAYVKAAVKNIEILKPRIRPFRRTELFLIEVAILATRVMEAMRRGRIEIAKRMFEKLSEFEKVCKRIAFESKESRLITNIVNSLKSRLEEKFG